MRKYTKEELNEVLRKHQHWYDMDCDGWEHMQADLTNTDLSGVDLSGKNLAFVCLSGANLNDANMTGTCLMGARLVAACLVNTNLTGADLTEASLSYANLFGADLSGAILTRTILSATDMSWSKNVPYIPMACPDTGSFIGWEKVGEKIVKLLIPEDAKRSSAAGRMCRCDKAIVLAIENVDGTDSGVSSIKRAVRSQINYEVGQIVCVPDFCEDRFKERSVGIRFFINRQEAVSYNG